MRYGLLLLAYGLILICHVATARANADDVDARTRAVTNAIQAVCRAPGTQGTQWMALINPDGSIGLNLMAIDGQLHFSREEWTGVQRILAAQQGKEGEGYRKCSTQLLNLFQSKMAPASKTTAELSSKVTCPPATPETVRLAVAAKNQQSSIEYFRCRETLRDLPVRGLLSEMFTASRFAANIAYLEALQSSGIDFIEDFPEPPYPDFRSYSDTTPLGAALGSAGVLNGLKCDATTTVADSSPIHWILTHSKPGSLSKYPELADELVETCVRGAYTGPIPDGWSRAVEIIAELRRAGLPMEADEYLAYRQAFLRWLEVQWQPPSGIQPVAITVYPLTSLRLPLKFSPAKAGPLAELHRAVAPQDPAKRAELQRRVMSEFAARWSKELDAAIDGCVDNQPSCESKRLAALRSSKLDLERLVDRPPPP